MKHIIYCNYTSKNKSFESIVAASEISVPEMYEEIKNIASNCGYSIKVYDDMSIDFIPTQNKEYMPEFHATATVTSDNRYQLDPKIEFPALNASDSNDYDYIEHVLKDWANKLGRLCTAIEKETYSNTDYEE